ncbi:hypothetical protein MKY95_10055 [Paenibacillus sp. FSL P4-0176]|uniref:hypothetical protein n=1 Tax=Paenibacillus sp. FSL P4-0176 TaxID=2921631 RepID=UPI0030D0B05C
MKELLPYIIPTLGFILNLTIFLVGRMDKKEEKKEKRLKEAQALNGQGEQLPPRSRTHR